MMEASMVLQSLDSFWFYTNILTCSDDPPPSLASQEPPRCDSPLQNLQDEIVEAAVNDVPLAPKPCEAETEGKDDGEGGRRKRRKRRKKKSERHGSRKMNNNNNNNGVDQLGSDDKKKLLALKSNPNPSSWTLPYHDEVAMKEHLKSWAYAVACIVK